MQNNNNLEENYRLGISDDGNASDGESHTLQSKSLPVTLYMSFIKLNRSLLDSYVFANEKSLKIWIWILLKCTYKKRFVSLTVGKGKTTIELNPGDLIFGRFKAEEELNIDGSTIYKNLKKFEQEEMIVIKSNSHYSIITVCNWEFYQGLNNDEVTTNEQPSNSQVTTNEQPSNTNKKDKKDKKVKEVILWRENFEIYKDDLRKSYNELLADKKYIEERERYHPNLDIKKTIEKACVDFWATEAGWKNKKTSKTVDIDWRSTFNNSLSQKLNQVWKDKEDCL